MVDADAEFAALRDDTPWQQNEILRYDKYVPEKRLGAGLAADRSPLLRQTSMHLRSRYRVEFSGVGALLYRDGDDFQGLHSDREMRWLDDTLIAIVVLGVRRPFVFRERQPLSTNPVRGHAGELDGDIVLLPGEGDLLVMGGAAPTRLAARHPGGRHRPGPDLAHLALDEPPRPPRHEPRLLRGPPVQRCATPTRLPVTPRDRAGYVDAVG